MEIRHISKYQRLVFSILIGSAVPLLSLGLQFGTRINFSSYILVRIVATAALWSMLLYNGVSFWSWVRSNPTQPAITVLRNVLIFWIVLLIPWLIIAPLSGMAFDGGDTAGAYAFFWSVLTYPITVGIAAVFRKRVPWMILLPLLNLTGCGVSEVLTRKLPS
jgi:hypothetical protein